LFLSLVAWPSINDLFLFLFLVSVSLVIGWLDLDRFVACDATRFRESRIQQRDKFSGLLGDLVRDILFAADPVDQWSHVIHILLHRESLLVLPVSQ